MRRLNPRIVLVVALGLVIGVTMQLLRLQRACEVPASEACAWGKTYLPLSLVTGAIFGMVFTGFVYVMASALLRGRRVD